MIDIGALVTRKSYNCDIIFEVVSFEGDQAILHGKTVRLIADAPLDDLVLVDDDEIRKAEAEEDELIETIKLEEEEWNRNRFLTGKILHIDGDERYMNKCLELYKKLGIYAIGVRIKETHIPEVILKYTTFFNPDIVVITGHDSFNRKEPKYLENYRHSKYFIEATKKIRERYPVINQPIIIAGACQSHFEALISAGANFASSPSRVNIKSLDPAIIAVKCATTPINQPIRVLETIKKTSHKEEGIGGIESFGTMKRLYY
ncbi:MAG TPA: sporulation peptidase YabG [Haloplasmataceae bacterium]